MDNKKHIMNRKNEQLMGNGFDQDGQSGRRSSQLTRVSYQSFDQKNRMPAANRIPKTMEWLEVPVENSMIATGDVFVSNLLCVLRMVRGLAAEHIQFNCTIGGLCKAASGNVVYDGGKGQSRSHWQKFALYSFQRITVRCKESVAGSGCRGLLPILFHSIAL